jgi:hypothetical protein
MIANGTPLVKRAVNGIIIVPALYLTLQHYPSARLFALVALGRNNSRPMARAMEGEREVLRQAAARSRSQQSRSTGRDRE